MKPQSRRSGLLIRELPDELLVYDQEQHRAHCLNRTAALVFRHADGTRTLADRPLRQRRFQPVVRLEFGESPRREIRDGLMDRFELRDSDVYEMPGPLDYTSLFAIAGLPAAELRDPPWSPMVPVGLEEDADLFAVIRAGDVLVHHPY